MRRRLIIVVMAVVAGVAGLTACGGPTPPSCAKPENQSGMSTNDQVDCLDQVSKWCQKNHPNEMSGECMDKVFGYIPGGES